MRTQQVDARSQQVHVRTIVLPRLTVRIRGAHVTTAVTQTRGLRTSIPRRQDRLDAVVLQVFKQLIEPILH